MTSTWWGGFLYAFLLVLAFCGGVVVGMKADADDDTPEVES